MDWDTAVAWASGFSFAGYDDWRLPTSDTTCGGYNCTGSETGHLWYVELGNPAFGPMTNTGSFQNLQSGTYWSGTEFAPNPVAAWFFHTNSGSQAVGGKSGVSYAMAVRPGDVPAVPEPQTAALLLARLIAVMLVRRQRPR